MRTRTAARSRRDTQAAQAAIQARSDAELDALESEMDSVQELPEVRLLRVAESQRERILRAGALIDQAHHVLTDNGAGAGTEQEANTALERLAVRVQDLERRIERVERLRLAEAERTAEA